MVTEERGYSFSLNFDSTSHSIIAVCSTNIEFCFSKYFYENELFGILLPFVIRRYSVQSGRCCFLIVVR